MLQADLKIQKIMQNMSPLIYYYWCITLKGKSIVIYTACVYITMYMYYVTFSTNCYLGLYTIHYSSRLCALNMFVNFSNI